MVLFSEPQSLKLIFISMINFKKNSGFTLIETLVAMTLGVLIMVMVMTTIVPSIKYVRSIKNTEKLHSEIVFFIDNLTYWIKQSNNLDADQSNLTINFLDKPALEIKEDSGKIKVNGENFIDERINITNLNFTKISDSVRVNLSMEINGSHENISITTTISKRN